MKIKRIMRCPDSQTYRAASVKAMFNVDRADAAIEADLPIEYPGWSIGLVVGPSGSGKTTLGRMIFQDDFHRPGDWPDSPIIEALAPEADFATVTAALYGVGLSSVPAWLKPYRVLSTGEKFRAELARIVAAPPARVVIDEFTSVVDRQTARVASAAFAKAWRRTPGQAVLLTCHEDIIDWLCPDWIYQTADGKFFKPDLSPPKIDFKIRQTGWDYWPRFEPHHYLKLPRPIAAYPYVAFVDDRPVAQLAVTTRPGLVEARAMRFVVMPEWQGVGIGLRFLEAVALMWRKGQNRYDRPMPFLINTSHPGLAGSLRRRPGWYQVSCRLHGENKAKSHQTLSRAAERRKRKGGKAASHGSGFGGHFRATQGFRFLGE